MGEDQDLGQEREVVEAVLEAAECLRPVDAEPGSLVPDGEPPQPAHDDVHGAAQGPLPGGSSLDPASPDETGSDEEVEVAANGGLEQTGDLLGLVIQVRVHRDDVVGVLGHFGESAPKRGPEPRRLLPMDDAQAGDLVGQSFERLPRAVRSVYDVDDLRSARRDGGEGRVQPARERHDVLPLVVGGDDDGELHGPGRRATTTT